LGDRVEKNLRRYIKYIQYREISTVDFVFKFGQVALAEIN
jgi:hypothetical protein